jgi:C-3',4' desaturase CrtD
MGQFLAALRPDTLITVPFALMTVGDALKRYGLYGDRRLKTFLDLQLKLYSQVDADETALLYAATALSISQDPQGLAHLQGSMQVLSDRLLSGLEQFGGQIHFHHAVEAIHTEHQQARGIQVRNLKTGEVWQEEYDQIIANLTIQNLLQIVQPKDSPTTPKSSFPEGYRRRIAQLPPASGAFVLYLGVAQAAVPEDCPPHLQFLYAYGGDLSENNSLFVSVSKPGDGRAPHGQRTIIASTFTDYRPWWKGTKEDYLALKQHYTDIALANLAQYFALTPDRILHQESATPRTFARFTHRDRGIVGGIGQRLATFGPFGIANRTPVKNLWLVGDSTHPGEGTAGVSYGALTVVRQIEQAMG